MDEEAVYQARIRGELVNHPQRFTLVDAFSGAGGFTLGFTDRLGHHFEPVWANDNNKDAVATYNMNFGQHCVFGDILDILSDPATEIPAADVVIGGPPCQGFSLLNRNRDSDPRKHLWLPFLEIVSRTGASVFVMENVPQLLGSEEHDAIVTEAESLGFQLASGKLLAADFGVPQKRWRAFIIGCNFTDPKEYFPPLKTHYDPEKGLGQLLLLGGLDGYVVGATAWRTVRDAVADLGPPSGTEIRRVPPPYDLHFGRSPTELSLQRYRTVAGEGMNRFDLQRLAPELTPECWKRKKSGGTDLFGRLWWDKQAYTIRTEFYKPEKGRYLHPEQHRPITHREAARFQSFPDSFLFSGSKIEVAKQIGNAVPPILAARIADVVYALLTSRLT